MHRPNHRRFLGLIAEGPPQFLDEAGKARVRHEGARPQAIVQLALAHHTRGFRYQHMEEIECLWRQVDGDGPAAHEPSSRIDRERPELDNHIAEKSPGSLPFRSRLRDGASSTMTPDTT